MCYKREKRNQKFGKEIDLRSGDRGEIESGLMKLLIIINIRKIYIGTCLSLKMLCTPSPRNDRPSIAESSELNDQSNQCEIISDLPFDYSSRSMN